MDGETEPGYTGTRPRWEPFGLGPHTGSNKSGTLRRRGPLIRERAPLLVILFTPVPCVSRNILPDRTPAHFLPGPVKTPGSLDETVRGPRRRRGTKTSTYKGSTVNSTDSVTQTETIDSLGIISPCKPGHTRRHSTQKDT